MVVTPDEFNEVVEERCKIAGVNFSGFKKWIRNTADTEYACEYKPVSIDGKLRKCWCLSKLKQEVIDSIVSQAEVEDEVEQVSFVKPKSLTNEELIEKSATKPKIVEALEHEDPEIKNAVWAILKKENTDPNSLSRVQIQAYIDDARQNRLKKAREESKGCDFYENIAH